MAAVAAALQEKGLRVTGSDQNVYPPMSTFLEGRKVEFMSGYAEEGSPYTWNSREGIDFLQKPFSPAVLAQKVRSVLDSAHAIKR